MDFNSKLIFLMIITQTSNKELAKSIYVDPSLISHLKSGNRKKPHNYQHIVNMAEFFAKKSQADFQRNAISEMLGKASISSSMPNQMLAKYLENWLLNDGDRSDLMENILENIDQPTENNDSFSMNNIQLNTQGDFQSNVESEFFFGDEGRRKVIQIISDKLLSMEKPCDIFITSDDNLEWLLYDYSLTKKIQSQIITILEKGFTFYQIMPAINFLPRYTDSLRFWLPMYSTGRVKVFYYPRLRDNLYRRSVFIIPNEAVRISNSIGLDSESDVTLFSTNTEVINATSRQFNQMLSMCRPAINVFRSYEESKKSFIEFFNKNGNQISLSTVLPPSAIPKEVFEKILENKKLKSGFFEEINFFLEKTTFFEEYLNEHKILYMTKLPKINDIIEGKVPIMSPIKLFEDYPCYTIETYVMHLKNIIYFLENYENFYFVPYDKVWGDYNLTVNEDGLAFLYKNTAEKLLLEFRRPELVMACNEYLYHIAEQTGYSGIHKTKVIYRLQDIIKELSNIKVGGGIIKRKNEPSM